MATSLVTFAAGKLGSAIPRGLSINSNQPGVWGTGDEIVGNIGLEGPGVPNIQSACGAYPLPLITRYEFSDGTYLVFWITGYLDPKPSRCYILLCVQEGGKFMHHVRHTDAEFSGEGAVEVAFSETDIEPIRKALKSVGFMRQLPETT